MADSWLTYAEYAVYGYEDVAEAEFPQLAATAALQILEATHWHAAAARDEASVKALADCQALLISDAALWGSAKASGAVTSVSNDGYAESYAAPAELCPETLAARDKFCLEEANYYMTFGRWLDAS